MIAFLTLCYVAILAILVWLKLLPNSISTWLTTLVWVLLLFIVLFIPMQWGAPAGPARTMTYSVQIIPNVAGRVTEVAAQANVPMKKGELLFKIDPTTYQAAVDAIQAQLKFQKLRLKQYRELEAKAAGTKFQVEETETKVAKLEADLQTAEWNRGDHGRGADRRLCNLCGAQAGPTGGDVSAAAGHDLHRYVAISR
ncbi:MAG: biotin/lipoyl-binding protein, partial [Hyphomicrobiaceae bacterium]